MNENRPYGVFARAPRAEGINLLKAPAIVDVPGDRFILRDHEYAVGKTFIFGFTANSGEKKRVQMPFPLFYYPLCGDCEIVSANGKIKKPLHGQLSPYQLAHEVVRFGLIQLDRFAHLNVNVETPHQSILLPISPLVVMPEVTHSIAWNGEGDHPRILVAELFRLRT